MNYRETMSRLNTALNNIDLFYAVIANKHRLTFNSLMMVYLIDANEKVTQKMICDKLHLPKSTVHSILLDFIKQEYITLIPGRNMKEKFVAFTVKGNKHFSKILEETQLFENKLLIEFGEDACAFLVETAENLGKIIIKEIAELSRSEGMK